MPASKVTVSIPRPTAVRLERVRRQTRRTRSAIVTEALDSWLNGQSVQEQERRHAEGYLKHPEDTAAIGAVAAAVTAEWEPWK